jgi:hypothetical protein
VKVVFVGVLRLFVKVAGNYVRSVAIVRSWMDFRGIYVWWSRVL